jgi:hypothetical protein
MVLFQPDGPFVRDERLIEQGGHLYLLAPHEDAEPLSTMHVDEKDREKFARRLLWNLLFRVVKKLHEAGVAHSDISQRTILVVDDDPEKLLLAGYSESARITEENSRTDCWQIFETVRTWLGPCRLKNAWTGNSKLDELWRCGDIEAWSWGVQNLCEQLDVPSDNEAAPWSTIPVTKTILVRYHRRNEEVWLNVEDVKAYAVLAALSKRVRAWKEIDRFQENADEALLKMQDASGWIDMNSYMVFCSHMDKRYSETLLLELLPGWTMTASEFVSKRSFRVPYNSRYGVFNLDYLTRIDPTVRRHENFRSVVQRSLEIRGVPNGQGMYIAVDHFSALATNLRYEERGILETRNSSLDEYTHGDWFVIAQNDSSELFPVNRENKKVFVNPTRSMSWPEFLEEFIPSKQYLDASLEHSPDWLFGTAPTSGVTHSCRGSVFPSEESNASLIFARKRPFNRPVKVPNSVESRAAGQSRTSLWIEDTAKRRKR